MPEESPFAWSRPWTFSDAAKAGAGEFTASRAAEREYERKLRSLAERIRNILLTSPPEAAEKLLREYAALVEPWALQSVTSMLAQVRRKNERTWQSTAKRMGLEMRALVNSPGVGEAVRERIDANMTLIKSLMLDSADQVAAMVRDNMAAGSRADDLAARIADHIGDASINRARMIARTEVSKAGTALTRARALDVGSGGYIWRTARDGSTRPSHRAMEGKFVAWDKPAELDGMRGHAGEFPNCRCYPEPVIPRDDDDRAAGVYRPSLPTQAQERNAGEKRLLSVWERTEGSQTLPHAAGTPLPNVDLAVYNDDKALNYSLNLDSLDPKARGHAKGFWDFLGMTKQDAPGLKKQVMAQLAHIEAERGKSNTFGERFQVYVPVTGPNGRTIDVLTAWIYEKGKHRTKVKTAPHLATIYIDKKGIRKYEQTYP
jgi:SPP1 gp7 family putative phage head morphogenesis protein